eukprot:5398150-Karenia_brevis.AAC.1
MAMMMAMVISHVCPMPLRFCSAWLTRGAAFVRGNTQEDRPPDITEQIWLGAGMQHKGTP